jgi:cell division protein FtsA
MYATCIGLILKGYNVYESSLNELKSENPTAIKEAIGNLKEKEVIIKPINKKPKTFKEFMTSIKGGVIDLFKEEGDMKL